MIRVILSGATGQVGAALAPAIDADPDLELGARVVVDFTAPAFAAEACRVAIEAGVPLVLGTTGLTAEQRDRVDADARERGTPVFFAPNFAIGAVLMMRFAREAARHLPRAEIVEMHADTKRDAPSGTALATAEAMGGVGQTLTIRHDTTSRAAFVPGVLLAVKRVRSLPPGLTVGLERLLDGDVNPN